jgi:hypothetical protein
VAEALTLSVRVDVTKPPEGGVTQAGLGVAVTPAGTPETVRLTAELNPLMDVTFMVEALMPP